jgi:DNA-binding NarL/FixJ family response regulator
MLAGYVMKSNSPHTVPSVPRILIVEDHDSLRASLRDWLTAVFPHAEVSAVTNGEEAIAAVQTWPPGIVVMDIGLPGMSGIEATRRIKRIAPHTHVVIVTIQEAAAYQASAAEAQASAFVPKRNMHTQLIPAVAGLLAQMQNTSGS